jgi:hypothetical protein
MRNVDFAGQIHNQIRHTYQQVNNFTQINATNALLTPDQSSRQLQLLRVNDSYIASVTLAANCYHVYAEYMMRVTCMTHSLHMGMKGFNL